MTFPRYLLVINYTTWFRASPKFCRSLIDILRLGPETLGWGPRPRKSFFFIFVFPWISFHFSTIASHLFIVGRQQPYFLSLTTRLCCFDNFLLLLLEVLYLDAALLFTLTSPLHTAHFLTSFLFDSGREFQPLLN